MNQILKYLALLMAICCVFPAGAASTKRYIKETINVQDGGQSYQVTARQTLLDGGNATRYSIRNLFDHNIKTAWVTKFDQSDYDSPTGTFEINFDRPVYVQRITIDNGYQKSQRLYSANQRVKELIVFNVLSKKSAPIEADLSMKDTMAPQHVSALKTWGQSFSLFRTRKLIFIVDSIYPGTHYSDLCISGITIHYAKGIEYSPAMSWNELKALVERNKKKTFHGGWDWAGFDNVEKYPQAFNDFLYYILKGNKEAYGLFRTYDPESVARSEDLKNFFKGAVEESLAANARAKIGTKP